MNRQSSLNKVRQYSFMLDDLRLYLDINPHDQQALACYKKYRAELDDAVKCYQESYGPLTANAAASGNKWTWLEHPWPWEKEAN